MKTAKLEQALFQIYDTQEKELDCADCFEQISEYVDREIAGEAVAARMPGIEHHLAQCKVCNEEYETLRDLVRQEAEGSAPSVDELRKALQNPVL